MREGDKTGVRDDEENSGERGCTVCGASRDA